MKIIFLKLYYWIIFILSFVFDILSSIVWTIDELLDFLDDKLMKHLIKIGDKIDGE